MYCGHHLLGISMDGVLPLVLVFLFHIFPSSIVGPNLCFSFPQPCFKPYLVISFTLLPLWVSRAIRNGLFPIFSTLEFWSSNIILILLLQPIKCRCWKPNFVFVVGFPKRSCKELWAMCLGLSLFLSSCDT